jgi:hypothetical protein
LVAAVGRALGSWWFTLRIIIHEVATAIMRSILPALLVITWTSRCFAQNEEYGQFAPRDAFENESKLACHGSECDWSRRQFEANKVSEPTIRHEPAIRHATQLVEAENLGGCVMKVGWICCD